MKNKNIFEGQLSAIDELIWDLETLSCVTGQKKILRPISVHATPQEITSFEEWVV